jgi:hypothetical protein
MVYLSGVNGFESVFLQKKKSSTRFVENSKREDAKMKRKSIVLFGFLVLIVFTFFGCSKTNESLESREETSVKSSSQPEEKTLFSFEPENVEKFVFVYIDGRIGEIQDDRLQEVAEKLNGFTYTKKQSFDGAYGWERIIEVHESGKEPKDIILRGEWIEYDGAKYFCADSEYLSKSWFDQYLPAEAASGKNES